MVLSLVERGWQAARERSLELQAQGVPVLHLVKGRLSRPVRELIDPKPNGWIVSVPRSLFWPSVWVACLWLTAWRRLRTIWVDNERSFRRLARWAQIARLELAIVRSGALRSCALP